MTKQNFNAAYLAGMDVDDMDYVDQFAMPPELAYTPEINTFMLDRVYEQNVQTFIEYGMEEKDAQRKAHDIRTKKRVEINEMMASRGLFEKDPKAFYNEEDDD